MSPLLFFLILDKIISPEREIVIETKESASRNRIFSLNNLRARITTYIQNQVFKKKEHRHSGKTVS